MSNEQTIRIPRQVKVKGKWIKVDRKKIDPSQLAKCVSKQVRPQTKKESSDKSSYQIPIPKQISYQINKQSIEAPVREPIGGPRPRRVIRHRRPREDPLLEQERLKELEELYESAKNATSIYEGTTPSRTKPPPPEEEPPTYSEPTEATEDEITNAEARARIEESVLGHESTVKPKKEKKGPFGRPLKEDIEEHQTSRLNRARIERELKLIDTQFNRIGEPTQETKKQYDEVKELLGIILQEHTIKSSDNKLAKNAYSRWINYLTFNRLAGYGKRPQLLGKGQRFTEGLYEDEIKKMMHVVPQFKGIYARDELKDFHPPKNQSWAIIMNMSKREDPDGGSHWVSIINNVPEKYIGYYNSLMNETGHKQGQNPPKDILHEMKRMIKESNLDYIPKLKYNIKQDQYHDSNTCGFHAMSVIIEILNRKRPWNIATGYGPDKGEGSIVGLAHKFGYII